MTRRGARVNPVHVSRKPQGALVGKFLASPTASHFKARVRRERLRGKESLDPDLLSALPHLLFLHQALPSCRTPGRANEAAPLLGASGRLLEHTLSSQVSDPGGKQNETGPVGPNLPMVSGSLERASEVTARRA